MVANTIPVTEIVMPIATLFVSNLWGLLKNSGQIPAYMKPKMVVRAITLDAFARDI